MKTRDDFVSNSSSCSFVIRRDNDAVVDAFKLWAKCFSEVDLPYEFTEHVSLSFRTKNKWMGELSKALTYGEDSEWSDSYDDYQTGKRTLKPPEEEWEYTPLQFSSLCDIWKDYKSSDILPKISELYFQTEDYDGLGMNYLRLLYLFFDRNGCGPDPSSSEHSFLIDDSQDSFMSVLCFGGFDSSDDVKNNG